MIDDEDGSWLRHPGTVRLRKKIASEATAALTDLLSRAASSSDPAVRAAFAKFDERQRVLGTLGGKNAGAETD